VERETLRQTFEQAADQYDRARPEYPAALYDDLVALAGLRPRPGELTEHRAEIEASGLFEVVAIRELLGDRRVRRHWGAALHVARHVARRTEPA
jgi:hypothetical protein